MRRRVGEGVGNRWREASPTAELPSFTFGCSISCLASSCLESSH